MHGIDVDLIYNEIDWFGYIYIYIYVRMQVAFAFIHPFDISLLTADHNCCCHAPGNSKWHLMQLRLRQLAELKKKPLSLASAAAGCWKLPEAMDVAWYDVPVNRATLGFPTGIVAVVQVARICVEAYWGPFARSTDDLVSFHTTNTLQQKCISCIGVSQSES